MCATFGSLKVCGKLVLFMLNLRWTKTEIRLLVTRRPTCSVISFSITEQKLRVESVLLSRVDLTTLVTWLSPRHCPHLLLDSRRCWSISPAHAALSSKLAARRCCGQMMVQTNNDHTSKPTAAACSGQLMGHRRSDTVRLHRPCHILCTQCR